MTPKELGRVVHAEHVKQAIASGGILVIPSPWQDLTDEHRACYIAQGQAVRYVLNRERVQATIAEAKSIPRAPTPAPRYDDVFFDGVAALNKSAVFDFDDTGHTPCPFLPWGECIHDIDEPEPVHAPPWKLGHCTGDMLSPRCWDGRLSQVARSIFSAVSVGIPLFLMREAPSPPCGNYHRICIER